MVIYENINENKIDKQIAKLKSKLLSGIFIKLKTLAPAKAGIDKRKEILAASTLLNFENLHAVITIPDLLTPGIIDNA